MHRIRQLLIVGTLLAGSGLWNVASWNRTERSARAFADEVPQLIVREIEGWRVEIDPEVVSETNRERGEETLQALANHLQRVRYIVPADRLRALQQMPIRVDWMHDLNNMQYHPSVDWLVRHGYDPRLEKRVHIPRAQQLLDPTQWAKHPYCVLHELAHAYHDQVLGFDQQDIVAAFDQAKSTGIYEGVLLYTGKRVKHYALSDHKEYFAESTEAYLGVNDFYPFVRAELQEHDPRMFQLMKEIWGSIR